MSTRSARKKDELGMAVRLVKDKKGSLGSLFPDADPMFLLFVSFFLDQLGNEISLPGIVGTFMNTTAKLYYPDFTSPPVDGVPSYPLLLLGYRRKLGFYYRFPEIVTALFLPNTAASLIREFNRTNAFIDSFKKSGKREPKT